VAFHVINCGVDKTGEFLWRLVVGLFVLAALAKPAYAHPYRVCTFSFNSTDEVDAIMEQLPESHFEFVDLSPPHVLGGDGVSSQSVAMTSPLGPAPWLIDACRPNLECDIVVFTGEFAGRFFGKFGSSLSLQDLEEASCMPRCSGIFRNPQEVFLLACNTLATKDEDSRTPEQYLRVLLDHGFDPPSAERVVNLRYGPLGPSFRESLRRTFMGVPRIYGFSSVAPRGEWSAALLTRYFRNKGDYATYLRRAADQRGPNREILMEFKNTSLVQMSGLVPSESSASDRTLICAVYDQTRSVTERLRIVRQILEREDSLSFLPTLQVFFSRYPPTKYTGEALTLFNSIQQLTAAREQLLQVVHDLNISALQMELAHLGYQLGWISAPEFRRIAITGVRQLLREYLSSETVDIMCEIGKHESVGGSFQSEDLPDSLFREALGLRFVECLRPVDERVNLRIAEALDSKDELTRLWAIHVLTHRRPLDDAVIRKVALYQHDPSTDFRTRIQFVLNHPR